MAATFSTAAAAANKTQSSNFLMAQRRRNQIIFVRSLCLLLTALSSVVDASRQFNELLAPDLEPLQQAAYGFANQPIGSYRAQYDLFQQENNGHEIPPPPGRRQQVSRLASQWQFADSGEQSQMMSEQEKRLSIGSGQTDAIEVASNEANNNNNNNNNADENANSNNQNLDRGGGVESAAAGVELARLHHRAIGRQRARIAPRSVLFAQQQQQRRRLHRDEQEFSGADSGGGETDDEQQPTAAEHKQREQQLAFDYQEGDSQQQQQQQRQQRALASAIEGDSAKQRDEAGDGGGSGSMSNEPQTSGVTAAAAAAQATSGSDGEPQNEQPKLGLDGSNNSSNNETGSNGELAVNHNKDEGGKQSGSLDVNLARFIKTHLIPNQLPESEHKRTDKLANEFGKLYRVLKVTSKWTRFLAHDNNNNNNKPPPSEGGGASGELEQKSELATNMERAIEKGRGSGGGQPQADQSARQMDEGANFMGLVTRRRSSSGSGGLLVGRLAKKTDWNALFVKLAKVFLQYFLDLMLNDMFGTTGSNSRSFVSTEIDMKKSLKSFLRLASGLDGISDRQGRR